MMFGPEHIDRLRAQLSAAMAERDRLAEQYASYREAAGASIGADLNQQASDRIIELEAALLKIVRDGDFTAPEGMKRIASEALLGIARAALEPKP